VWVCQRTRIVIISKDEHMHKRQFRILFWTLSSSLINCLCGELFILSAGGGLCFDVEWKVFRKFCPLCYKQVIALSPRGIGDEFSLVFSGFSQIALVATRLGQFCENFEGARENLSLILLGLMRLHIRKGLLWLIARLVKGDNRWIPSWTGFNIKLYNHEPVMQDVVGYLPTINAPVTQLSKVS